MRRLGHFLSHALQVGRDPKRRVYTVVGREVKKRGVVPLFYEDRIGCGGTLFRNALRQRFTSSHRSRHSGEGVGAAFLDAWQGSVEGGVFLRLPERLPGFQPAPILRATHRRRRERVRGREAFHKVFVVVFGPETYFFHFF